MVGMFALGLAGILFVSGCESDDDPDGGNSSVVGTWTRGDDTRYVYRADGTWDNYKDAALTSRHFGGTYTQSGSSVNAQGTNPGVGDLEVIGTISADGNTMEIDFIEHWHDPYKHVPGTLIRL